jgi:cytoskeletal protein RodZ
MAMATKATSATRPKSTYLNLRGRRADCGLSLETIADSTKISIRFLRAIEDEEFEKLPGGIFNTSYLRQYAAAIGFDEAKLLTHYSHKAEPKPADEGIEETSGRGIWRWLRVPMSATGR